MRLWFTLGIVVFVMVVGVINAGAGEPVAQKKEYIITTIKLTHIKPSELLHSLGWCSKKSESCRYCAPTQELKPDDSQTVSKPENPAFLVRSITPVDLPEGIAQIAPFDLDSSMIVKGTPEGVEKLEFIISEADYERRQVAFDPNFVEVEAETMELLNEKLLNSTPAQGDGSLVCISASKKLLSSVGIPLKMMEFSSDCPGLADDKLVTAFTLSKSPLLRGPDDPWGSTGSDINLQILPTINADGFVTVDLLINACQLQKSTDKNLVQAKLTLTKDDVILLFRNSKQKNVLVMLVPKVMDEK